jgi:hypothetical protein
MRKVDNEGIREGAEAALIWTRVWNVSEVDPTFAIARDLPGYVSARRARWCAIRFALAC